MAALKWVIVIGGTGYVALAAFLFFMQRSLLYFPDRTRVALAATAAGLEHAEEIELATPDGERLVAWHIPPDEGRPVVLYFQGNAGSLGLRAHRFARLRAAGMGVLAIAYRGYGGSTGRPTEEGLLRDGQTAYQFAASHYGAERVVLWGESLGTGVAVALAAERPVARMLLESPFSSTADVAAASYWFLPVRALMLDQYRSADRIAKVTAPVLVIHGARDNVVPIRFGERLYERIRAPKRFIRIEEAGHDLDRYGAFDRAKDFLAGDEAL